MTPTRGTKNKPKINHEQRRRRLRHLASYASSLSSPSIPRPTQSLPQVPAIEISHQQEPSSWRDGNNNSPNVNPSMRPHLVGAFIFKTESDIKPKDDLRLYVFDQYEVRLRREEPESSGIERIAAEFANAAAGKSNYVTSVYLIQKQVPIGSSSECLFELGRKAFWRVNQKHRTSMNFQRKYVEAVMHEYDPIEGNSFLFKSVACVNLSEI